RRRRPRDGGARDRAAARARLRRSVRPMKHPMRGSPIVALFAAVLVAVAVMGSRDAAAQSVEVAAAAPANAKAIPDRPRVGLVLSGGGARGGAHLGVLKVLEE